MNEKLDFWNQRGLLPENAGTNDWILKHLELDAITVQVTDGSHVLDVGCGDGSTLVHLAKYRNCTGVGIDFAENMVARAKQLAQEQGVGTNIAFRTGSLLNLDPTELFDYVLTERSLINLASDAEQHHAFCALMRCLKVGGRYLMVESFAEALERTNEMRNRLGLDDIRQPWHNHFVSEKGAMTWQTSAWQMEGVVPFSSTYYFLSRVIYAKLAADNGEELQYDSPINMMSIHLPPIGDFGPARLWQWRRVM